ncbi:MAG TPA: hypothetical protein VFQ22_01835 [Longimicrobiales bacterium]|nr:hypothetical protein [Longimicrobiales bacterium]
MTAAAWRAGRALAVCALTALAAAACDEENPYAPQVIEEITFDPSLGIDLGQMTKLPEGVYIQDLVAGAGAVIAAGDSIRIDHTGWLSNGAQFSTGVFDTRHPSGS